MKLGLVGYPQTGKRTLFGLLTGAPADREGGVGLARVLDERFEHLAALYRPAKRTPAAMEFALLPSLGQEASRNAAVIESLRDVDAVCHVVRAFADETVFHVAGRVDPRRDIRLLADELLLADLVFVEKRLDRLAREQRAKRDARSQREEELLERIKAHLEEGSPLRTFALDADDEKVLSGYPLLTRKPLIQVLNVDEAHLSSAELLGTLMQEFEPGCFDWIAVSARIEQELAELDGEDRQAFLAELGLDRPVLERLTQVCYAALGLISFFTVGEDEVRAWAIPRDSTAPRAGRAIHSDIERGFIRAEVMRYDDLVELGSEERVKELGRLQTKGRDYVVLDGDILHFLHKA